ncbi:MAG TPA: hypothetical protein ENJ82_08255 [Bacteroidetes bacterium]|nr:hypothetical protein [Bacteroidota bacterium]
MKDYNEKLEALLLNKDYATLTGAERAYVSATLGDEAAYAAERVLRVRSRALLVAESVPDDPAGLAIVMARTRRNGAMVPLWQAAAAVLLVAVLAWWGKGLALNKAGLADGRLALADTVYREVRVLDTVYLPAPQAADHPLLAEDGAAKPQPASFQQKRKATLKGRRPKTVRGTLTSKLAEAIATLPEPGIIGHSGGGRSAKPQLPIAQAVYSDKIQIRE